MREEEEEDGIRVISDFAEIDFAGSEGGPGFVGQGEPAGNIHGVWSTSYCGFDNARAKTEGVCARGGSGDDKGEMMSGSLLFPI